MEAIEEEVVLPKFDLGMLVATPNFVSNAERLGLNYNEVVARALRRHTIGDWGDCCEEDSQTNDQALKEGSRLLSVYMMEDTKFWVITEWDRSVTTVLMPEDY